MEPKKHDEESVGVSFPADAEVDNLGRPKPEAERVPPNAEGDVTFIEAPAVTFGDDEDADDAIHEG